MIKRLALSLPMPLTLSPSRERRAARVGADVERLTDIASRAVVVCLFSMMAVRFGVDFFRTGRVTGLLLLVSELLVVVLTVMRRSAAAVDRSMRARVLTTVSMLGPSLLKPASVVALLPQLATVGVSAIGLGVVIAGKVTLGRSFGLMPANRGIVSSGVYRIVRHPIYMGYLITHAAYVAAMPSVWNVAALAAADLALLARAVCEERTLARDPRYREYQQVVRWRVCPGLF
jgi:protein-S-isoprenylcysteine O-methyltransferase Ste14